MKFHFLGDTAVLIDLESLTHVLALFSALAHAQREGDFAGVIEFVPAATTLLAKLDTTVLSQSEFIEKTRRIEVLTDSTAASQTEPISIPVAYNGADLSEAASITGLNVRELIDAHTSITWTAAFGGFAPGFMYLVTDAPWFEIPRLASPRTHIPAGSVALAGGFSAVYPAVSPGGWQLLGITEEIMWETHRARPSLIMPGDTVRFIEV
ncbi:allophanate hydrolase subunit 1 [Corynebacterium kutscheri]|uniref:Allophanate hydrolase subunit 1 n=1 Tax=Corynebacterium kutscheri TaxID=35755 RepID=A0A0F6TE46_9CORY|nr:allophanate hydrolase subunit 1 [Corynebacterium kutscheri]AKE41764.1 allophanate hydrolase subunit 1 [Corynebacterium kutscheri]VEH09039.1 allophanate hydrolase subunit 1 [Corynebacterium kutscheri]VEH10090.1 allophanate hydrolase subunit 1 [Corynebacterium kutscheri]VEH80172.1 allophanate hydrolase subunit 1 [Corynebacterium kutscheri]